MRATRGLAWAVALSLRRWLVESVGAELQVEPCAQFQDFTADVEGEMPPCVDRCPEHTEVVKQVCARAALFPEVIVSLKLPGFAEAWRVAWALGLPPHEVSVLEGSEVLQIRSQRLGLWEVRQQLGHAEVLHVSTPLQVRRLSIQGRVDTRWLIGASVLFSCLCCCWLRMCRCVRSCLFRKSPPARKAVEGPPPDTHWRCAEGELWWKGATDRGVARLPSGEPDILESPRPPPSVREPDLPRRSRSVEAPQVRPSTAPEERRAAWPMPPRCSAQVPRPPDAASRSCTHPFDSTGAGLIGRPCTPLTTAPCLDLVSGQELVQTLRHLKRQTSDSEDRRKLFKELQLRWHPDKNVGDEVRASEMFKALQESKAWFLVEDRPWSAPGVVSDA